MNNNELRLKNVGEIVILKGFVNNKRKFKGKTFIDLRDREGITQLIVNQDTSNITKESVIKISGEVVKRIEFNKDISTGEVEVFVSDLEIISIAKQIPFEINKKIDINENLRLEYRYLDLRRKKMYENLLLKSKVKNSFINFLSKKRFLDVETPSLSKITPEGARDFIVPTRNKGKFFSLPQSPQIYKQLLMIGGIEKYFQFVKVFRDEDMRKDRQPEFTQLDMEMSFHTPEMIQKLIEKMFLKLGKDIKREIKTPFLKMDYLDAMERFGSDKPDLRFENEIKDVTNYFKKSFFKIAKMSESVKYIFIDKKLSNKQKNLKKQLKKMVLEDFYELIIIMIIIKIKDLQ
ncbi:MAG: hypothetical protein K4H23_03120 [Mollicutes bacterium PWAP]|nr:hypothetical protein [Mollicutes bacterium PWAP]